MEEVKGGLDPKIIGEFSKLGGLLEKMGSIIEEIDAMINVMNDIQSSISTIKSSFDLLGKPEGIYPPVLEQQFKEGSTAAMTVFYLLTQVPGLMPLIAKTSSIKDITTLSPEERKQLALDFKQVGKRLQEISLKALEK